MNNSDNGSTHGTISIILGALIILLNVPEIVILCKKGRNRKHPEHIILSLAFSDNFVGIAFLTVGIMRILHKFNPHSSAVTTMTSETRIVFVFTVMESVSHLIAIAGERLFAVMRPLRYRALVTYKRMVIIVILVWVFAIAVVLFSLLEWLVWKDIRFGTIFGSLIIFTEVLMLSVYGYLAYFLCKRFQRVSSDMDESTQINNYNDQKRDTILCIGIAAAFIICSFCAAISWLLPKRIYLLSIIGEYLLAANSVINPLLYFWKSFLSRKRVAPNQITLTRTNRNTGTT